MHKCPWETFEGPPWVVTVARVLNVSLLGFWIVTVSLCPRVETRRVGTVRLWESRGRVSETENPGRSVGDQLAQQFSNSFYFHDFCHICVISPLLQMRYFPLIPKYYCEWKTNINSYEEQRGNAIRTQQGHYILGRCCGLPRFWARDGLSLPRKGELAAVREVLTENQNQLGCEGLKDN